MERDDNVPGLSLPSMHKAEQKELNRIPGELRIPYLFTPCFKKQSLSVVCVIYIWSLRLYSIAWHHMAHDVCNDNYCCLTARDGLILDLTSVDSNSSSVIDSDLDSANAGLVIEWCCGISVAEILQKFVYGAYMNWIQRPAIEGVILTACAFPFGDCDCETVQLCLTRLRWTARHIISVSSDE